MSAPIIVLDAESSLPAYEQISSQIRMQIVAGRLYPGDALPSVRQLARDLDIAPNTVVRAYNEVVQQGWMRTSARRGFTVAKPLPISIIEERKRQLQLAVEQVLLVAERLRVTPEEIHAEIERQLHAKPLRT
jgi:GntR family transcriptional regulator